MPAAVLQSAVQKRKSNGQKWIIIALVSVNHVMHDSSVLDQKLKYKMMSYFISMLSLTCYC